MVQALIFKSLGLLAVSATLVACGGGGGDAPGPLSPLAAYAGKWGSCDGAGRMDWLVVNPSPDSDELLLEFESSFHANADCSGSAGAYLIHSGASVVADKTGEADVNLPEAGATQRLLKADTFRTTTSPGTVRVLSSGMTVDYTQLGNTPGTWCVNGVAGASSYCFKAADEALDEGLKEVGFVLDKERLVGLEREGGTYVPVATFSRL